MKHIFLTSEVHIVISDVAKHFPRDAKRVLFVTTAAESEQGGWTGGDNVDGYKSLGFDVVEYSITDKTAAEHKQMIETTDILHVNGGNTFYLLDQARQSGFVDVVREYVAHGGIYVGSSAGSIIAGPDIGPSQKLDSLESVSQLNGNYEGFDLVDFVLLPHWGTPLFKELYLNHRLEHAYTDKHTLILLNDNQYVHVKDDWWRIVDVKKRN